MAKTKYSDWQYDQRFTILVDEEVTEQQLDHQFSLLLDEIEQESTSVDFSEDDGTINHQFEELVDNDAHTPSNLSEAKRDPAEGGREESSSQVSTDIRKLRDFFSRENVVDVEDELLDDRRTGKVQNDGENIQGIEDDAPTPNVLTHTSEDGCVDVEKTVDEEDSLDEESSYQTNNTEKYTVLCELDNSVNDEPTFITEDQLDSKILEITAALKSSSDAALRRTYAEISALLGGAKSVGGGSTVLMDNDDVVFKQKALLANNDILRFSEDDNKFVANSIQQIVGQGGNSMPIFIQNTAPVTTANKYLWIETHLGTSNTDMTFWVEDGT